MMKAEGRSRAITIFHRVLEIPVKRRMDFLAEACAGDSALRIEVQELLDNAEKTTTSLLDTEPCGRIFPQRPRSSPPIFAPGDVVGQRYEVIALLRRAGWEKSMRLKMES
jgi:hypothetical protein